MGRYGIEDEKVFRENHAGKLIGYTVDDDEFEIKRRMRTFGSDYSDASIDKIDHTTIEDLV